jgi:hypothetical protein
MAQRSRPSPESTPEKIRAARIEGAPSHLATARQDARRALERRAFELTEVLEPFVGVTRAA